MMVSVEEDRVFRPFWHVCIAQSSPTMPDVTVILVEPELCLPLIEVSCFQHRGLWDLDPICERVSSSEGTVDLTEPHELCEL